MESNDMFTGDAGAAGYVPGMAELVISQIYVQPQNLSSGDQVILGAEVHNRGTAPTGPFYARFSLDTGEIVDMEMPNIEPGTSYWRDWEHGPLAPGNYTFYVSLDPEHRVPEINRYGNNSTHTRFTVNPAAAAADEGVKETTDAAGNKVKEISFEDEPMTITVPVTHIGKGQTGTQEISDLLESLKGRIRDYWSNYGDGLHDFQLRMSFSSEQEAEPHYLDAAFKAIGKQALDLGLGRLGEELGGHWGKAIGTLKAIGQAWAAEQERVEKAEGQVKIVKYIESLRNGIGHQRDAMIDVIESGRIPMMDDLAVKLAHSMSSTETGTVTGDAAQFLQDLHRRVEEFRKAIPSAAEFQQRFTEAFAYTPVMTDYISHGGREAGTLRIHAQLGVDSNKQWEVDSIDDQWTLVTVAPEPGRLAGGLASSLSSQGKKPWQAKLEKLVQLTIGFDDGYIVFTSNPDQYEVRSNYDTAPFEQAWKSARVRQKILGVEGIRGSSD
jgi:hypothetical protein